MHPAEIVEICFKIFSSGSSPWKSVLCSSQPSFLFQVLSLKKPALLREPLLPFPGASSPKSALCFSSPSSEEDSISLLRFVFHGTPERNLDSILRNGLLRWYRKHGCDWFGVDPKVSRGYCRGDGVSGTLLVFLILPVNRAVADDFGKYILTINCASYQLPIGTVKWVYETEAEPQNQPISEVVS